MYSGDVSSMTSRMMWWVIRYSASLYESECLCVRVVLLSASLILLESWTFKLFDTNFLNTRTSADFHQDVFWTSTDSRVLNCSMRQLKMPILSILSYHIRMRKLRLFGWLVYWLRCCLTCIECWVIVARQFDFPLEGRGWIRCHDLSAFLCPTHPVRSTKPYSCVRCCGTEPVGSFNTITGWFQPLFGIRHFYSEALTWSGIPSNWVWYKCVSVLSLLVNQSEANGLRVVAVNVLWASLLWSFP